MSAVSLYIDEAVSSPQWCGWDGIGDWLYRQLFYCLQKVERSASGMRYAQLILIRSQNGSRAVGELFDRDRNMLHLAAQVRLGPEKHIRQRMFW
jgi:hypothetical protein